MLFTMGRNLEGVQGPIGGIQGIIWGGPKAKTIATNALMMMIVFVIHPSYCHVSDICVTSATRQLHVRTCTCTEARCGTRGGGGMGVCKLTVAMSVPW